MSHDRAWWDLGRASSDVIEGHCSKHSRHLMGFQVLWKHIWGICASYFVQNGQDFQMKEVYHLAIQYGVYLLLARLWCIYIFLISKCGSPVESATLPVTIDNLPAPLAWKGQNHGYWGVIKMSVNTNIFAGKFVSSLPFCRSAVCIQRI